MDKLGVARMEAIDGIINIFFSLTKAELAITTTWCSLGANHQQSRAFHMVPYLAGTSLPTNGRLIMLSIFHHGRSPIFPYWYRDWLWRWTFLPCPPFCHYLHPYWILICLYIPQNISLINYPYRKRRKKINSCV